MEVVITLKDGTQTTINNVGMKVGDLKSFIHQQINFPISDKFELYNYSYDVDEIKRVTIFNGFKAYYIYNYTNSINDFLSWNYLGNGYKITTTDDDIIISNTRTNLKNGVNISYLHKLLNNNTHSVCLDNISDGHIHFIGKQQRGNIEKSKIKTLKYNGFTLTNNNGVFEIDCLPMIVKPNKE